MRVSRRTHALVRAIAKETGRPLAEVLDRAVEELRRETFLERSARAYERLRGTPAAWRAELRERELWESTVGDALEER